MTTTDQLSHLRDYFPAIISGAIKESYVDDAIFLIFCRCRLVGNGGNLSLGDPFLRLTASAVRNL